MIVPHPTPLSFALGDRIQSASYFSRTHVSTSWHRYSLLESRADPGKALLGLCAFEVLLHTILALDENLCYWYVLLAFLDLLQMMGRK
jgi:hypothetical protein